MSRVSQWPKEGHPICATPIRDEVLDEMRIIARSIVDQGEDVPMLLATIDERDRRTLRLIRLINRIVRAHRTNSEVYGEDLESAIVSAETSRDVAR